MEEKHECEMLNVPECSVRHILFAGMFLFALLCIGLIFAIPILENAVIPILAKTIVTFVILVSAMVFTVVVNREIIIASRLYELENQKESVPA